MSYVLSLVIYRLHWSPLAAFPGPFLAKVTHWYEFYHNFVRTGKYYERIREMHDKYGVLFFRLFQSKSFTEQVNYRSRRTCYAGRNPHLEAIRIPRALCLRGSEKNGRLSEIQQRHRI